MKTVRWIAVVLAAALSGNLVAQDKGRQVKVDDFEGELSGWMALRLDETTGIGEDADSKIAITREAGQVKAGKGSLSYSYEVAPNRVRVLARQREGDIAGMKSLRLWVKCSHATAVILSLAENGGASWQTAATCAAGAWQEVAVNLDELTPDEIGKDPNGKLDLDLVESIQVFDIGSFLVNILADIKSARTLWLDEIAFSAQPVTLTTGLANVTKVVPVFLVDNFESPVIRWSPISLEFSDPPKFNLFDRPVSVDKDAPSDGGKQSLKFAYPRKGAKIHALMRNLEKVDLSRTTGLDLALKTSTDGTFIVGLEEKDGSRYQKVIELKAADGWKSLSLAFGDLALADDSKDDNGRLDPAEIKQITVADITPLAGGGEADEVVLRIDQVLFTLAP